MTKEEILALMKEKGKADALDLRSRAKDLDGTALIAEESKIPQFDPTKDYSTWAVGSPVYEIVDGERQVFTLITPHNASYYPGSTPSNTRALWSLKHAKDAAKAKPWVAPSSGAFLRSSKLRSLKSLSTISRFLRSSRPSSAEP